MKKIIFISLLLQWIIAEPVFSMNDNPGVERKKKSNSISAVVINADVTVVLLNYEGPVHMDGDDAFKNQVIMKQNGSRLIIDAVKNARLVNKGIIYVPASSIDQILINSAAHLKSAGPLEIPRLDIRINGECKIHIVHIGELNLIGNDYYEYTRESKEITIPARMLKSWKE